jgi:hypothetical protein
MNRALQAPDAESGRGQGNAASEVIPHPATGEALGTVAELESVPVERLADALLALDEQAAQLRRWRKLLDAELAKTLDMRGRDKLAIGDYELHRKTRNESVWDGDELETVLRRLVDEGVVDARELVGVITHETVVSKSKAGRLVDQLAARERRDVEACRTWKRSVSGVEVVRATPLLPE